MNEREFKVGDLVSVEDAFGAPFPATIVSVCQSPEDDDDRDGAIVRPIWCEPGEEYWYDGHYISLRERCQIESERDALAARVAELEGQVERLNSIRADVYYGDVLIVSRSMSMNEAVVVRGDGVNLRDNLNAALAAARALAIAGLRASGETSP